MLRWTCVIHEDRSNDRLWLFRCIYMMVLVVGYIIINQDTVLHS